MKFKNKLRKRGIAIKTINISDMNTIVEIFSDLREFSEILTRKFLVLALSILSDTFGIRSKWICRTSSTILLVVNYGFVNLISFVVHYVINPILIMLACDNEFYFML